MLGPYWAGWVSGETVLNGGHLLMVPAMVAAMLYRLDEYTRPHRHAERP